MLVQIYYLQNIFIAELTRISTPCVCVLVVDEKAFAPKGFGAKVAAERLSSRMTITIVKHQVLLQTEVDITNAARVLFLSVFITQVLCQGPALTVGRAAYLTHERLFVGMLGAVVHLKGSQGPKGGVAVIARIWPLGVARRGRVTGTINPRNVDGFRSTAANVGNVTSSG